MQLNMEESGTFFFISDHCHVIENVSPSERFWLHILWDINVDCSSGAMVSHRAGWQGTILHGSEVHSVWNNLNERLRVRLFPDTIRTLMRIWWKMVQHFPRQAMSYKLLTQILLPNLLYHTWLQGKILAESHFRFATILTSKSQYKHLPMCDITTFNFCCNEERAFQKLKQSICISNEQSIALYCFSNEPILCP